MPGSKRMLLTRLAALAVFVLGVVALVQLTHPADGVIVSSVSLAPTPQHEIGSASIATVIAAHQAAPLPTITPDPSWLTVQEFSGQTSQDTSSFTVAGPWRIVWSFRPLGAVGSSGLFAQVLDANGQKIAQVAQSNAAGNAASGIYSATASALEDDSLHIIASRMVYDFTVQVRG